MKKLLIFILSLVVLQNSFSQEEVLSITYIDSLEENLNYLDERNSIGHFNKLANLYFNISLEKAENYASELLRLSKKYDRSNDLADAYYYFGKLSFLSADFSSALEYYDSSLISSRLIEDTAKTTRVLTDIGLTNYKLGNIEKAQQYFLFSLSLSEKMQSPVSLAKTFFEIGNYYWEINQADRAKIYVNNALSYYTGFNDQNGIQKCLNQLAFFDLKENNLKAAKQKVMKAIEIGIALNDELNLSNSLMLYGEIYYLENMYLNAQNFLSQSLEKKINVGVEDSYLYYVLGKISAKIGKFNQAEQYYFKGIELAQKQKNKLDEIYIYSDLYKFYRRLNDADNSYKYLNVLIAQEDTLNQRINFGSNLERQIRFETNIVKEEIDALSSERNKIRLDFNESQRRQKLLRRAFGAVFIGIVLLLAVLIMFYIFFRRRRQLLFKIAEKNKDIVSQRKKIIEQSAILHETNRMLEKLSLVAKVTENAILLVQPNGDIEWVNHGFTRLLGYTLEEIKIAFGQNIFHKDSLYNIKDVLIDCILKRRTISKIFQFVKKDKSVIWINSTLTPIYDEYGDLFKIVILESDITKIKDAEQEIINQKNEIQEQWEEIKSQKEEIEKQIMIVTNQKKGLIDSILYAKRIQNAIFPQKSLVRRVLTGSFLLHKPKDIVSGDFFWIKEKGDKIVFVVADTTLQGVPGALLSLLGILFLENIVERSRKFQASHILNQLNESIYKSISGSDDLGISKSGLDISLIIFDKKDKSVQYSGGNNRVVLVRDGKASVIEGDKLELGKVPYKKNQYTNRELNLLKDDMLYLFTDGYQKQFYIESPEKDRQEEFYALLESICNKPVEEQKRALNLRLRHFYRGISQVDDALVVGIRF